MGPHFLWVPKGDFFFAKKKPPLALWRSHKFHPQCGDQQKTREDLRGSSRLFYDLLLGLKMRATRKPKKMAAPIPAAVAVIPPAKAPARPFSFTAL